MTRRAVAYVRRSSGHESPLSLTAQQEATSAAANARDDIISHTYKDWGKSGGDRSYPDFLEMMDAIEQGQVSAVYAYDADRLSRRESTLHLLLDAAEDSKTAVIDRTGRDLAAGNNRLTAGVLALVDARVLRDITERNRANRDAKVLRGDDLGEAPYGWSKVKLTHTGVNSRGEPAQAGAVVNVCTDPRAITTVLNAYHAAGSALGAARLLNAAGFKTKRDRTWGNRAVGELVAREAPELLPARMGRTNARHYRTRVLSGLLRCYCGNVMSPNGKGWTCAQGARGAHDHPYNVAESKVLPWVRDEADRFEPSQDILDSELDTEAQEALAAKRVKVLDLYLDDKIDRATLEQKLAEIEVAIGAIDLRSVPQEIPQSIDWDSWSGEDINGALRGIIDHVQLGDDLLPTEAEWRVQEWRPSGRGATRGRSITRRLRFPRRRRRRRGSK